MQTPRPCRRPRERPGGVGVERGQTVEAKFTALEVRERPGGFGVERGQAVKRQIFALELRECLGGIGVEPGQAVQTPRPCRRPRERPGGINVERGQTVEGQIFALEVCKRPSGVGVERGQAVEVQRVALELRECLGGAGGIEGGDKGEVAVHRFRQRQCGIWREWVLSQKCLQNLFGQSHIPLTLCEERPSGVGVERGQAVEG